MKANEYKYKVYRSNGTVVNAGTNKPSWFTLDQARKLVENGDGERIYEHDGVRKLWETF